MFLHELGQTSLLLGELGSRKHVFFDGEVRLQLSTASPDLEKGDGRQASHWKDDELTGVYIGIMDPTIEPGASKEITTNDLQALDGMGYRLSGEAP